MSATIKVAVACLLAVASTTGAWAQQARPTPLPEEVIQPDRPDLTNGAHIVDIGLVQVELGGMYTRVAPRQRVEGTPAMVRVGLTDWMEARVSTDGILSQKNGASSVVGTGNVQLGAKVRLWADGNDTPVVAILPTVNLPTASAAKGLGSGTADYSVLAIVSKDLGTRGHVDADYGFAEVGVSASHAHFAQHLASVSASLEASAHWNPYAELFWLSRNEPNGRAVTAVDAGAIYRVGKRLALDGGLEVGFPAPKLGAFAGVSVIVGNVMGHRGVRARQRKAARRAARHT